MLSKYPSTVFPLIVGTGGRPADELGLVLSGTESGLVCGRFQGGLAPREPHQDSPESQPSPLAQGGRENCGRIQLARHYYCAQKRLLQVVWNQDGTP